jgi:transcription elongation factor Elf1
MKYERKRIVCISCGGSADIKKQNNMKVVVCPQCERETELDTYQEMFDEWIDNIRKEG